MLSALTPAGAGLCAQPGFLGPARRPCPSPLRSARRAARARAGLYELASRAPDAPDPEPLFACLQPAWRGRRSFHKAGCLPLVRSSIKRCYGSGALRVGGSGSGALRVGGRDPQRITVDLRNNLKRRAHGPSRARAQPVTARTASQQHRETPQQETRARALPKRGHAIQYGGDGAGT